MADIKHFVRIAKTDLNGQKPIGHSLKKIKGVGFAFAHAACALAGVDKHLLTGTLKEKQIKDIEKAVENPAELGAPTWLFNRRKNPDTGKDTHLLESTLVFAQENDVKKLRKVKCYRGIRHQSRLPCRGQRTRSNFRRNKGKTTLGVQRKKGK